MARTISKIKQQITADLQASYEDKMSVSKVAEWSLWAYVQAVAIHALEVIYDLFRKEIEEITDSITPGSRQWYAEMCYRFQYGEKHVLKFDTRTAKLYYEEDDPSARIIKVVAVSVIDKVLYLKVAKINPEGRVVELSGTELESFERYKEQFKFACDEVRVISDKADLIRYEMDVYYDPAYDPELVRGNVLEALDGFRTSLSFDAMFYSQHMLEAVRAVDGVVTVALGAISRYEKMGDPEERQHTFDVRTELYSGYFDYHEDCLLSMINNNDK